MALLVLSSCSKGEVKSVSIVPKPVSVENKEGTYTLNAQSSINFDADNARLAEIADLTSKMIAGYTGIELTMNSSKNGIKFKITDDIKGDEAYKLSVDDDGIEIKAAGEKGIFYGVQTLRQMIEPTAADAVEVACVEIEDSPRLPWRGMHLDVSRHFFSKDEVKKFIDVMSMYKINTFHWHLTDDQGWRIEIKKYPKLTEIGAWRKNVGFVNNQERGLNTNDGKPYGGFYTQEDIKEVIDFAKSRNVEVVPEIEIPGHAMAALTAYPEYYCFPNEKLDLWMIGGVSDGVYCAGKEQTFAFLEDVLTEVIDLFPSQYIHVGGDEAPKANWQKCPQCKKRMADEKLADAFELQSYFMHRIEKFVNSKGRKIIGWDEIMEGGLSKTATVMSWRGLTPGLEAAEMGNQVIMTPGTPCYISRAQSINDVTNAEPDSEVLTMRDLYEFDPVPKELGAEYHKNIIGVQVCQWAEGTPNMKILMFKSYPRAIAMAEIGWTPQDMRRWDDFYARVNNNLKYLDAAGVEHGPRSYDVRINIVPDDNTGKVMLEFITEVPGDVYYTMDGSEPTKQSPVYSGNQEITGSGTIKARMYEPSGKEGRLASQDIYFHKALGKKVAYAITYSSKHDGGGEYGMTNGQLGRWQGFEKRNVDMTLDLGKPTKFSSIQTQWKYDIQDWVFRPIAVTYEISKDGQAFEEVFSYKYNTPAGVYDAGVMPLTKKFDAETEAQYIRVKAENIMTNPTWHTSSGAASWIFVDEIVIE